jgi:hypothetical protein
MLLATVGSPVVSRVLCVFRETAIRSDAAYSSPEQEVRMIRKLSTGEYRLYSRKKDPRTGKRRNLGTFKTRAAAEKHERAVQFFKRRG